MNLRFSFAVSIVCLFLPLMAVSAQKEKPKEDSSGDGVIHRYLSAEADRLAAKVLDGAKTADQWRKRRPRLYQEYMDMLGLWPVPEKTPLQAKVAKTFPVGDIIVENVHFQSKPGLYVTGNLYRPKKADKKLPAVLYVCGHSNRGRDGSKAAYQDHPRWFAENGYVCLILDTLQLGEVPGVHHGTYGRPWLHLRSYGILDKEKEKSETRWWWHSAGYTPAGVECWNGIRAIDYLLTRPEVDPDRIGVTGISGGGAATFWIAAADDRVKVAVPVSGMSDLESYVKNRVVNGHCDCMFLYNTHRWDWTTIAALVAPRPLLFANSDNDRIFPMDGNRRVIAKLRDLYKMYGKPDLVDEYVSVGGHAYRPDLRIAIFRFINEHLKGDARAKIADADYKEKIPGPDLRAFPTEADLPTDAINHRIDEVFVPRAVVKLPPISEFPAWQKNMVHRIRTEVLRPIPAKVPPAIPRPSQGWLRIGVHLETEPGIVLSTLGNGGESLWLVDGTDILTDNLEKTKPKWQKLFQGKQPGMVLFNRQATLGWTRKSPPNYVERSLALLGRTPDTGRVRDALAAWRWMQAEKKKPRVVMGVAQGGIIAAYAALLEPTMAEVVVVDPPKSHLEGPHFLGVLRVLDVPEALGLLAPRPLTIYGGKDRAFDRTEEIYRLAGAADKLTRK